MLIVLLTLTPGYLLPQIPRLADLLSWDKLAHLFLFCVETLLIARMLASTLAKKPAAWIAALLGMVFGGIIEIVQASLPLGRSGNVYDFIADIVGSLIGMWIFLRMTRFDKQTA